MRKFSHTQLVGSHNLLQTISQKKNLLQTNLGPRSQAHQQQDPSSTATRLSPVPSPLQLHASTAASEQQTDSPSPIRQNPAQTARSSDIHIDPSTSNVVPRWKYVHMLGFVILLDLGLYKACNS